MSLSCSAEQVGLCRLCRSRLWSAEQSGPHFDFTGTVTLREKQNGWTDEAVSESEDAQPCRSEPIRCPAPSTHTTAPGVT